MAHADALVLWGGADRLDEAIEAYGRALADAPADGRVHFRLGVAHRMRFDRGRHGAQDFRRAVEEWSLALDLDPNQYIWRRRMRTARQEIAARGETPRPLRVEPSGAEMAYPADSLEAAGGGSEPDPQTRIARDTRGFVALETVVVPPLVVPGAAARVHVILTPNAGIKAPWNNEVGETVVWVDPPVGWQVSARRLAAPRPREPVSAEPRRLELEVRAPAAAAPGPASIPAYALYYVCEDVRGRCLYRRQDFSIPVEIGSPRP